MRDASTESAIMIATRRENILRRLLSDWSVVWNRSGILAPWDAGDVAIPDVGGGFSDVIREAFTGTMSDTRTVWGIKYWMSGYL